MSVSSSDQAVVSFSWFGVMQPVQVSLSGVEERGGLRMQWRTGERENTFIERTLKLY